MCNILRRVEQERRVKSRRQELLIAQSKRSVELLVRELIAFVQRIIQTPEFQSVLMENQQNIDEIQIHITR